MFPPMSNRVNISYLLQQHTKVFFKIDVDLTMLSNVYFLHLKA